MRSMWQILCEVLDGKITTRAQAQELLREESDALAKIMGMDLAESRRLLKKNLDDVTEHYYTPQQREKIKSLFDEE